MRRWCVAVLTAVALTTVAAASSHRSDFHLEEATLVDINAAMDSGTLTSEQLVKLYLARIAAYEDGGPKLNAILTLNPKAIETAIALDKERKSKGPRGPLHGVPVLLKDNIDTFDM